MDILFIIELVTLILIILVILVCGFLAIKSYTNEQRQVKIEKPEPKLLEPPKDEFTPPIIEIEPTIRDSKELLIFLQDLTHTVVDVEFKDFKDSVLMDKITKEILKQFIKDTAIKIYNALNELQLIEFSSKHTFFRDKFFMDYIILMTSRFTKELMEREVV